MRDDPLFVGVTNAAGTRPGYVPEVPFKGDVFGVSRSLDAESRDGFRGDHEGRRGVSGRDLGGGRSLRRRCG